MDAPRDNLTRTADFTVTRAEEDDDGLTLEGYAAVFNSPTRIDSMFEGTFDEIIAPGAFKRTIGKRGAKGIRLQFDHGQHPLIGSIPLGSFTDMHEDARGLFVRARLSDNWLVQPVRDAIRDGSVDGMSFRFRVPEGGDEWDRTGDVDVRTVNEIDLLEAGPVVWPAYEQTSVGVRTREIVAALMDPEQRTQVARALLAGTSPEPADTGPSDEPAASDGPPEQGPRRTKSERRQTFRRLFSPNAKEVSHEAA